MSYEVNMDQFDQDASAIKSNSGLEFGDIQKMVFVNGATVRLLGQYATNWEHFVNFADGRSRPYYCGGPKTECPLCVASAQMSADPNEAVQAQAPSAKQKFYFNCLDRSVNGRKLHQASGKASLFTQNVKANNVGTMVFTEISKVVSMRKQQGQPYGLHLYDLMLQKTGSQKMTRYAVQFTGDLTPLTEEEKAYELWPVDQIAKLSTYADLQAAADAILTGVSPSRQDTSFNVNDMTAAGPVQAARQAAPAAQSPMAQAPAVATAPQSRPVTAAPPPAVAPRQATPQLKATAKPPVQPIARASTVMDIPCVQCGYDMAVDMAVVAPIVCKNCGQTHNHPGE